MADMDRPITDPFLKRSVAALIVAGNSLLAFMFFEHGGCIEGLLYDSRLLVANGMSPIVAMKLQRAWSSITTCTLQHPYLRTLYSVLLADGLYGDTVLLQVPWLLSSFFETAAQLVLILASLWIMVLHFEPMSVPHILSIMIQLFLIQLYSGLWTLVALWTFQSSIEEMIEVIAASRGPTIVLSYDPQTQRMTAREMSPPRLGRRLPGTGSALEPEQSESTRLQLERLLTLGPEDDAGELQSQDDSSGASASQASSQDTQSKYDTRSSEGFTRGPQIESDSTLSDEESIEEEKEARQADGTNAGKDRVTPTETDELRSNEVRQGVELITFHPSDRPTDSSAGSSKTDATKAHFKGSCKCPDGSCPKGPTDSPAAGAVCGQAPGKSSDKEIAQSFQLGPQRSDIPDAPHQKKQTSPRDSGPGFTKIIEEGDNITKKFIPSAPPEPNDSARRPQKSTNTAADASRRDEQDGSTDSKTEPTVCPGTRQGRICPPGSKCCIKEREIRSTEAKAEPAAKKPKSGAFKDEVPLGEQLIVVDTGNHVMTDAHQRVVKEATEAIPIRFTKEEHPLDGEETVDTGDAAAQMSVANAPPEEGERERVGEVDDLSNHNPTEENKDRLRGGEQPFEDDCCLSNVTCRVHEEQCPMHKAMQACFEMENASEARIKSSLTPEEIILHEEDEKATFASVTGCFHPPDAPCGQKELDIPVQIEHGGRDALPIHTGKRCSPDGFCWPNEQDISVDIPVDNLNASCVGTISDDVEIFEDISDSNTHAKEDYSKVAMELILTEAEVPCDNYCLRQLEDLKEHKEKDISKGCQLDVFVDCTPISDVLSVDSISLPLKDVYPLNFKCSNGNLLESEKHCAIVISANFKSETGEEIKLDQGGITLTTGNTSQQNIPKKSLIMKEQHVFSDDRPLNKVDIKVDIGITNANITASNVFDAPEILDQHGGCENPSSFIYETEGIKPEVQTVTAILNTEMNEKICSEDTKQHNRTKSVLFASEKNLMSPHENITVMNETESLKDVCPGVGDTHFEFSDNSTFVPVSFQASCCPVSHCPEKQGRIVQTTYLKGDSVSNHSDVADETDDEFFDVPSPDD